VTREVVRALAGGIPGCTAEEVADILLMAGLLSGETDEARPSDASGRHYEHPFPNDAPPGRPGSSAAGPPEVPLSQASAAAIEKPGTRASAVGLRAPAAISRPLTATRALSLFKRVGRPGRPEVDIDATVEATADAGRLQVVTRPGRERGLDVALVADTSPVMTACASTVAEFETMLARTGAFRSISRWTLLPGAEPMLGDHAGIRQVPEGLIDPDGRRLVLVVTDGTADHWRQPATWQALRRWAQAMPTAVIHILPKRYRAQGPFDSSPIVMRSPWPAAPNSSAEVRVAWWDDSLDDAGPPMPVVGLAPAELAAWARAVTTGSDWADAAWTRPVTGASPRDSNAVIGPEGRVRAFHARASHGARALARVLAGAPVLSLPLIRVLQEGLVPGTGTSELAEVLASGLLERIPPARTGQDDRYQFRPLVSDLLRRGATAEQEWHTYEVISGYLDQHAGTGSAIRAYHADPYGHEWADDLEPFAAVTRSVAARLGLIQASGQQADSDEPAARTPPGEAAGEGGARWQRHGGVERLELAGLTAPEAHLAATTLLDSVYELNSRPPDLRRLLVLDETARLQEHSGTYQLILASHLVEELICVAQGPRGGKRLSLPWNLGGTQGSPVLWVSDPVGIDWRPDGTTAVLTHATGGGSGLDRIVEVLSVNEVFDAACRAFQGVPYRVASPGLRLTGADDEAAVFAGALAAAIGRLCEAGPAAGAAYAALMPAAAGAALDDDGPLARYSGTVRRLVAEANLELAKAAGLRSVFRRRDSRARANAVRIGQSLGDLRDLVIRLLQEPEAAPGSAGTGRPWLGAAGISFAAGPAAPPSSLVYHQAAAAIREGNSLPGLSRLLTIAERDATRRGSESYLPEAEGACPQWLLDELADPPSDWNSGPRPQLLLSDAARAARDLTSLILNVADREWSPSAEPPAEFPRLRAALEGVQRALLAYADEAAEAVRITEDDQSARLGQIIAPILQDLVIQVIGEEPALPSTDGTQAGETAELRAARLLTEWEGLVTAVGLSARPSFAVSHVNVRAYASTEADIAEIREVLQATVADAMWQLCAPNDLSALDVSNPPQAVPFAPRTTKDALIGGLVPLDTAWTSSGAYAGLLRLVSLRPESLASPWDQLG
jgi:hypothetical protein